MEQNSKTKINRVKKDISNPKSFTAPDELRQQLMETMKSLYSDEDIEMVSRAYDMAFEAHKDQKRKSGNPILFILFVSPLSWPNWNWTGRRSLPVCCTMWWKTQT